MKYETAIQATEQIIRKHSKTFFLATTLLPVRERSAIRSLYAFCRASDDLADCASTRLDDFETWRAEVRLPAGQQRNPILFAWAHVREQYNIDTRYENELLEGIRMDLQFHPYATWAELQGYCYRVASTVGLLSMPVIGLAQGISANQAAPQAIKLGIALQLTNILRDIGEDLERGRMYLPIEDLKRFGLTVRDVQNRLFDERFISLMRFEIKRARRLYAEAVPGIALLSPKARPAVGAAALLYRRILDEIEAIHYQVYTHRAYATGWRKIAMLPGLLLNIHHFSARSFNTFQGNQ